MTIDSALKKDENYCPQVFLKECKYTKKVIRHNTEDIEVFLLTPMENNYVGAFWAL